MVQIFMHSLKKGSEHFFQPDQMQKQDLEKLNLIAFNYVAADREIKGFFFTKWCGSCVGT